jgi:iron complex transport system ATP-binding protein
LSALAPLAEKKKLPTLIYMTHHLEEILPAFNRALVMKNGRIIAVGATKEAFRNEIFNDLYGLSVQPIKKNGRYWPITA